MRMTSVQFVSPHASTERYLKKCGLQILQLPHLRIAQVSNVPWNKTIANQRTIISVPAIPPKVNIGSFETDITSNLRDIYVYWQQIPPELKNGEKFQYKVSISVNDTKVSRDMEVTDSYVKFTKMSLHSSYEVAIQSKNSMGLSKESTVLTVPANDKSTLLIYRCSKLKL